MGTGQSRTATQAVGKIKQPPKCSICRQVITDSCTWRQGRCPHVPATISSTTFKTRFNNIIKFFKGTK